MKRLLLAAALLSVAPAQTFPQRVLPPILMYHRIDPAIPRDPVGRDLTVTPAAFAEQLRVLRAHRVQAISMADLASRLKKRASLDRVVVLTFDDGYADQILYALPLLRRYDARATFYIVTGTVGTPGHLTWRDLRRLISARMDIGAHGVAHDDLSQMTAAQQEDQIFGSVRSLRRGLRVPIETYAYPSGRFNRQTLPIVRRAGLEFAVTTDAQYVIVPGDPYELTRIRVHGAWNAAALWQAVSPRV